MISKEAIFYAAKSPVLPGYFAIQRADVGDARDLSRTLKNWRRQGAEVVEVGESEAKRGLFEHFDARASVKQIEAAA